MGGSAFLKCTMSWFNPSTRKQNKKINWLPVVPAPFGRLRQRRLDLRPVRLQKESEKQKEKKKVLDHSYTGLFLDSSELL